MLAGLGRAAGLFREGLGDPRRQCGMVPHQQRPLVGDLGDDQRRGQSSRQHGGLIEAADLGAAGLGADGIQRIDQGGQPARRGEKGDGHAALGKQAEGLGGDLHAAQQGKAFQVGQGHVAGLGAVFIGDGHCGPADADPRAAVLADEMQPSSRGGQSRRVAGSEAERRRAAGGLHPADRSAAANSEGSGDR